MSLLCTNPRYCFIHVQRTAGKSMMITLEEMGGPFIEIPLHCSWRYLTHTYPSEMRGCFTFAFVRNPWDLYVSWYNGLFKKFYPSFNEFMLDWREWWNTPKFNFRNQTRPLLNTSGGIGVDFVGRYENLEDDFACVLDRIGLPPTKLKRFGWSTRPPCPYAQLYTPDTRDIVAHIASPTIKAFDYAFEE